MPDSTAPQLLERRENREGLALLHDCVSAGVLGYGIGPGRLTLRFDNGVRVELRLHVDAELASALADALSDSGCFAGGVLAGVDGETVAIEGPKQSVSITVPV